MRGQSLGDWSRYFQTLTCQNNGHSTVFCQIEMKSNLSEVNTSISRQRHGRLSVCSERRVLSGRDLSLGLITRPEESYWLCCVVMCHLEIWRMRRPWAALGRSATGKKKIMWIMVLYVNGFFCGNLIFRSTFETESSKCLKCMVASIGMRLK